MDIGKVGILQPPRGPGSGLLLLVYHCGRQLKSGGGEQRVELLLKTEKV